MRRRGRRHRLRLRVSTGRGNSFTVNVSTGGFCTELMRVYPVGQGVEGVIDTPHGPMTFSGRVAWSKDGDPRLNLRGRMGVCFVQIDRAFASGLDAAAELAAGSSRDRGPAPCAAGRG